MNQEQRTRDFIWNAVGSFVYALASIVLAFSVIRLAGADEGGIFGFGFSTLGQQMFIVAYFGIRPFHITDMQGEYSFGDYLSARRLTTGLAMFLSLLFVGAMTIAGKYTLHKLLLLFLITLYKIIDGYADVYESELQRQHLLYKTGKSLAYRTTISVLVLLLSLCITGQLLPAIMLADLSQAAGTYLFAVRPIHETVPGSKKNHVGRKTTASDTSGGSAPSKTTTPDTSGASASTEQTGADFMKDRTHVRKLLRNTSLLFLSVFLDFYIFSASKYAVDSVLDNASSGFFNILFMPTSFIYLVANFLIRPTLTALSDAYGKKEYDSFEKISGRMTRMVIILTLVILALAAIFGRIGLRIFEILLGESYEGRLTRQFITFLILIAGGGIYALVNVMYYILVTIRAQKTIFIGYAVTAVVSFLTAERMVKTYGLLGGSVHYLFMMLILFVIFSLSVVKTLESMRQKAEAEKPAPKESFREALHEAEFETEYKSPEGLLLRNRDTIEPPDGLHIVEPPKDYSAVAGTWNTTEQEAKHDEPHR